MSYKPRTRTSCCQSSYLINTRHHSSMTAWKAIAFHPLTADDGAHLHDHHNVRSIPFTSLFIRVSAFCPPATCALVSPPIHEHLMNKPTLFHAVPIWLLAPCHPHLQLVLEPPSTSSSTASSNGAVYRPNFRLSITRIGNRAYPRALDNLANRIRLGLVQADDARKWVRLFCMIDAWCTLLPTAAPSLCGCNCDQCDSRLSFSTKGHCKWSFTQVVCVCACRYACSCWTLKIIFHCHCMCPVVPRGTYVRDDDTASCSKDGDDGTVSFCVVLVKTHASASFQGTLKPFPERDNRIKHSEQGMGRTITTQSTMWMINYTLLPVSWLSITVQPNRIFIMAASTSELAPMQLFCSHSQS